MEQEDRWTCLCGALLSSKYPPLCPTCRTEEEKRDPFTKEEQRIEVGE